LLRSFARRAALSGAAAVLLLIVIPAASSDPPIKPWTSGATPPLELSAIDGRKMALEGLKGRVVVINYWATWCEPCIDEMPSLERLRVKMKGRPFEVLAVNYGESAERVSRFVAKMKLTMPVLLDPYKNSVDAWKVRGLPMTFIVDAKGQVRYWSFGERDWSQGEALQLVERMVSEANGA
jgi:thiol-disulfide isomerase/thioredoxin